MNEYYTLGSLLQFGGAVVAVTLVVATVGYLLGASASAYLKWVALVAAMGLAFLGAAVTASATGDPAWTKWVVAFFNGVVVFLAAVGANQLAAGPARVTAGPAPVVPLGVFAVGPKAAPEPAGRKFWKSWV